MSSYEHTKEELLSKIKKIKYYDITKEKLTQDRFSVFSSTTRKCVSLIEDVFSKATEHDSLASDEMASEAKALRWLANNFPYTNEPEDVSDKMSNAIHLYATAGADKIEELQHVLQSTKRERMRILIMSPSPHPSEIVLEIERFGYSDRLVDTSNLFRIKKGVYFTDTAGNMFALYNIPYRTVETLLGDMMRNKFCDVRKYGACSRCSLV